MQAKSLLFFSIARHSKAAECSENITFITSNIIEKINKNKFNLKNA